MEEVRYGKYVSIFTVTFIAMIVVAVSIFSFIDYDPGASAGIVEVLVSAVVTVVCICSCPTSPPKQRGKAKTCLAFVLCQPIGRSNPYCWLSGMSGFYLLLSRPIARS